MAKIKIYCVTNVELKHLEKLNLNLTEWQKSLKKIYFKLIGQKYTI